jgi:hypothetical protein
MKIFLGIVAWCLLLLLCWPIAIFVLILFPIIWLLSLPFRLLSTFVESILAFIKAVLFLPARLLGYRGK